MSQHPFESISNSAAFAKPATAATKPPTRSETFAPLRLVPADKVVVLGLVTTKRRESSSSSRSKPVSPMPNPLISPGRRALSRECGFATSVAGNAITGEAQRAKLDLLVRAARDLRPA
jgi:5-methyltetrahydropteroyltriglutamate--homocysteine methyltransferase